MATLTLPQNVAELLARDATIEIPDEAGAPALALFKTLAEQLQQLLTDNGTLATELGAATESATATTAEIEDLRAQAAVASDMVMSQIISEAARLGHTVVRFDAEKAPTGAKTPRDVMHSVVKQRHGAAYDKVPENTRNAYVLGSWQTMLAEREKHANDTTGGGAGLATLDPSHLTRMMSNRWSSHKQAADTTQPKPADKSTNAAKPAPRQQRPGTSK